LLFNLLDRLARNAGCSDAVWSLIADFAAAETRLLGSPNGSLRPSPAANHMALSAQALVHCFGREGEAEPLSVEFEPDGDWAPSDDDADGSWGELSLPQQGGFHKNAFAQLDWERLEALDDED